MHNIIYYTEGIGNPNDIIDVHSRGHLYYATDLSQLFIGDTSNTRVWDKVSISELKNMRDVDITGIGDRQLLAFSESTGDFTVISHEDLEPTIDYQVVNLSATQTFTASSWSNALNSNVTLQRGIYSCNFKYSAIGSDRDVYQTRFSLDGTIRQLETVVEPKTAYTQTKSCSDLLSIATERAVNILFEVLPVDGSVSVGDLFVEFRRLRY